MDDELKRRIAEDLRKAGFESEMLAIEEFSRRPAWICEGSVGYFDKDQDLGRELDLSAYFGRSHPLPNGGSAQCGIRIVGEVKKSERPWVAFRERPQSGEQLIDAWNNVTSNVNLPDRLALSEDLSRFSLLTVNGWKARGIHESFKQPSAASTSYAAFVSVCKAAEAAADAEESLFARYRVGHEHSIFFTLIKPLVIVDGILVSATPGSDASIEIEEVPSAAIRFQFRTARYARENYAIDLVTLSYLPRYLTLCEQRIGWFLDALATSVDSKKGSVE